MIFFANVTLAVWEDINAPDPYRNETRTVPECDTLSENQLSEIVALQGLKTTPLSEQKQQGMPSGGTTRTAARTGGVNILYGHKN